jgi:hypothetical protein
VSVDEISVPCKKYWEALTDLIGVDFHEGKTYAGILDLADTLETELEYPILLACHLGSKAVQFLKPSHLECSYLGVLGPKISQAPKPVMLT